ncbi:MAG: cell division protein SepF [Candidatus Obscuribacterales bacterium]|nr:cell division protein SepF [Candidatus Obscuribacterales bacterium]
MSDDVKTNTADTNRVSNSQANKKPIVDLFPALTDKRMLGMQASRQAPPMRMNTQISIFTPVSFEEALEIVECLRGRAATTISLENMKKLDANRLVDFVAGASAALDGDFHKLSDQVYIFCPSNIKITADSKDNAKESNQAASFPDDIGALDFLYPAAVSESQALSSPWLKH